MHSPSLPVGEILHNSPSISRKLECVFSWLIKAMESSSLNSISLGEKGYGYGFSRCWEWVLRGVGMEF